MIPKIRRGAEAAGRSLAHFEICHKPLVAAGTTEAELTARIGDVRAQLAFYISTPSYRPAVAYHGLDDLARELSALARAQEWEKMPGHVSEEVLELFAVIGTHDEIADRLCQRFADVVTSCEFSIAVRSATDRQQLARIAARVHAHPSDAVHRRLAGAA
jgi:alkanesulfonate monooxygenase SsuD/methylene tetrahydromethanopterin reductase-like flavin-dependent oxidoreductase (luciferase family)